MKLQIFIFIYLVITICGSEAQENQNDKININNRTTEAPNKEKIKLMKSSTSNFDNVKQDIFQNKTAQITAITNTNENRMKYFQTENYELETTKPTTETNNMQANSNPNNLENTGYIFPSGSYKTENILSTYLLPPPLFSKNVSLNKNVMPIKETEITSQDSKTNAKILDTHETISVPQKKNKQENVIDSQKHNNEIQLPQDFLSTKLENTKKFIEENEKENVDHIKNVTKDIEAKQPIQITTNKKSSEIYVSTNLPISSNPNFNLSNTQSTEESHVNEIAKEISTFNREQIIETLSTFTNFIDKLLNSPEIFLKTSNLRHKKSTINKDSNSQKDEREPRLLTTGVNKGKTSSFVAEDDAHQKLTSIKPITEEHNNSPFGDDNDPIADKIIERIKMLVSEAALENIQTEINTNSEKINSDNDEIEQEPEFPEILDSLLSEKIDNLVDRIKSIVTEEQLNLDLDKQNNSFADEPHVRVTRNANLKLNPDNPFLFPMIHMMNRKPTYHINPENPFLAQEKLTGKITINEEPTNKHLTKEENKSTDLNMVTHNNKPVTNNNSTLNPADQAIFESILSYLEMILHSENLDEPEFKFNLRFGTPLPNDSSKNILSMLNNTQESNSKHEAGFIFSPELTKQEDTNPFLQIYYFYLNLEKESTTGTVSTNFADQNETQIKGSENNNLEEIRDNLYKQLYEFNSYLNKTEGTNNEKLSQIREDYPRLIVLQNILKQYLNYYRDVNPNETTPTYLGTETNNKTRTKRSTDDTEHETKDTDDTLLLQLLSYLDIALNKSTDLQSSNETYNDIEQFLLYLQSILDNSDDELDTRTVSKRQSDGNTLQYDPIGFLERYATKLLPKNDVSQRINDIKPFITKETMALANVLPEEYIKLIPEILAKEPSKKNNTVSDEEPSFDDVKDALESKFDTILENGNIEELNQTKDSLIYKIKGADDFALLPNDKGLELKIFNKKFGLIRKGTKSQPKKNITSTVKKMTNKITTPPVLFVSSINEPDNTMMMNESFLSNGPAPKLNVTISKFPKQTSESNNPYLNRLKETENIQQYFIWQKVRDENNKESEWIHLGKRLDDEPFDDRIYKILDFLKDKTRDNINVMPRFNSKESSSDKNPGNFVTFTSPTNEQRINTNQKMTLRTRRQLSAIQEKHFSNEKNKYKLNKRLKRQVDVDGKEYFDIPSKSDVSEARSRADQTRKQIVEQDLTHKRIIEQLFSDNLISAFQRAANIKPIDEFQPKANRHNHVEESIVEEAKEPVDDNYEKNIVQITPKPAPKPETVEQTNNNIVKERKYTEISRSRNSIRRKPTGRSTSIHQIVTVDIPDDESYSIGSVSSSQPVQNQFNYFEEVETKPDQPVELQETVRRRPAEIVEKPTEIIANTHLAEAIQSNFEELMYVKKPTSDLRRQHIEAIKKTRRPIPKNTDETTSKKEKNQEIHRNRPERLENEHTEQVRRKPTPISVKVVNENPETTNSFENLEVRPLEEQPEIIKQIHTLYLANLNKEKKQDAHKEKDITQERIATRRPQSRRVPQKPVEQNSQAVQQNTNTRSRLEATKTVVNTQEVKEIEYKPLAEQPEEIKQLHKLYLASLNKAKTEEAPKQINNIPESKIRSRHPSVNRQQNFRQEIKSEPTKITTSSEPELVNESEFKPLAEQPQEIQELHKLYITALQKYGKLKEDSSSKTEQIEIVTERKSDRQKTQNVRVSTNQEQTSRGETEPRFRTTHSKVGFHDLENDKEIQEEVHSNEHNSHLSHLVSAFERANPIEKTVRTPKHHRQTSEPETTQRKARVNRGKTVFRIEDYEKEIHSRSRRSTEMLSEVERKIIVERQKLHTRTNRGHKRFQMKKQHTTEEPPIVVKPLHKLIHTNRGKIVFRKEDHIGELENIHTIKTKPHAMHDIDIPFESQKIKVDKHEDYLETRKPEYTTTTLAPHKSHENKAKRLKFRHYRVRKIHHKESEE